jgi:hypothetical protein
MTTVGPSSANDPSKVATASASSASYNDSKSASRTTSDRRPLVNLRELSVVRELGMDVSSTLRRFQSDTNERVGSCATDLLPQNREWSRLEPAAATAGTAPLSCGTVRVPRLSGFHVPRERK